MLKVNARDRKQLPKCRFEEFHPANLGKFTPGWQTHLIILLHETMPPDDAAGFIGGFWGGSRGNTAHGG